MAVVTDDAAALIGVGFSGRVGDGLLEAVPVEGANSGGVGLTEPDEEEVEMGSVSNGGVVVLQGTDGKSGLAVEGNGVGRPPGFWCIAAAR